MSKSLLAYCNRTDMIDEFILYPNMLGSSQFHHRSRKYACKLILMIVTDH
jgi:hypothetical protein